jgi:hypothetical protein
MHQLIPGGGVVLRQKLFAIAASIREVADRRVGKHARLAPALASPRPPARDSTARSQLVTMVDNHDLGFRASLQHVRNSLRFQLQLARADGTLPSNQHRGSIEVLSRAAPVLDGLGRRRLTYVSVRDPEPHADQRRLYRAPYI